MSYFYNLLSLLLVIVQRSLASFPIDNALEEEPAVAAVPEPVSRVPIAHPHVAPVAATVAAPAAPAPYYPYAYPYNQYAPYHHPRTEVHNIVKSYAKEAGQASETLMVSGGGHLPAIMDVHPPEHMSEVLTFPAPWHSRLHRQKMAKKTSRTHKSFDRKGKN
ncbi:hypothetical protein Y032_0031g2340 [Ancylostoma ceylanicum]|uniref:Uncharacterized protein n=1 Tax=Ancylostoma ceylanicum TaxID=53326 RepID=A0A016UPV5_9BILA|nr:hypothetical protein Y032_0031g2340 [Ancylostoma ceylanicum]